MVLKKLFVYVFVVYLLLFYMFDSMVLKKLLIRTSVRSIYRRLFDFRM